MFPEIQPDTDYVGCIDENSSTRNISFPENRGNAGVIFLIGSYAVICFVGLLGNGLVIFVILRYAKMKTVTNMYILNLAIADSLFLLGMPFLIVTTILRYWVFGMAMCKIYFVLISINFFTSVFTLTALSGDRYLAVCHAIRSVQYRTARIAFLVCLCIWFVSFLVMLPTILYSKTVENPKFPGKATCGISWPSGQLIAADKAYMWYIFLLAFAIPVSLISVFYLSVIIRLRTSGPIKKSKEKKKSHRKVTTMVLSVISVYVICWLPYWVFQVNLTFKPNGVQPWEVDLFNAFTVLTFANSTLNPVLYAFLSDNFRKSFLKAFRCSTNVEVNKYLSAETSTFRRQSQAATKIQKTENYNMLSASEAVPLNNTRYTETTSTDVSSVLACRDNNTKENDISCAV